MTARKESGGMTQAELASLLHVSPRSVQAYEAGEVIPYRQLRDIERALGKPAAWFLHGDEALPEPKELFEQILKELASLRQAVNSMEEQLSALVEERAQRPRSKQPERPGHRSKD